VQGRVVTARLRKARHLVLRFFGHYRARPLSPNEQRYVHDHLSAPCAELFWKQSVPDQRHAIIVAGRVEGTLPGDAPMIEAALLHDIGKWRPNPGAISRSIATILELMRLPMTKRMWAYRDHGPRGAVELEQARCGELAVEFARLHPAPPPEGIDEQRWEVLMEADE
jgi:hypothetical protein